jgi:hypothetical protein
VILGKRVVSALPLEAEGHRFLTSDAPGEQYRTPTVGNDQNADLPRADRDAKA